MTLNLPSDIFKLGERGKKAGSAFSPYFIFPPSFFFIPLAARRTRPPAAKKKEEDASDDDVIQSKATLQLQRLPI
jgi:hypothetical protein